MLRINSGFIQVSPHLYIQGFTIKYDKPSYICCAASRWKDLGVEAQGVFKIIEYQVCPQPRTNKRKGSV